MSASVTIYNDGEIDIQILKLNPHTGQQEPFIQMPAQSATDREPQCLRIKTGELLIISTAEKSTESPRG